MKRFFYIITARNNTRIEPDSPYRVASGQIRASDMESALAITMARESITRERNPSWTMRVVHDLYRQGQRVGVYISPVADDMAGDA